MFEQRDHVHTLPYNYLWELRRDPDGVAIELALDHLYRGLVSCSSIASADGPQRRARIST